MGSTPQVSVLKGTNRPLVLGAGSRRLHELYSRKAASCPHHIAFLYEDIIGKVRKTTYKEAEDTSNRLARAILAAVSRDITGQPKANSDGDFIIAVALPPSDDLVFTLLAVWKAGAAYLPLDAASPRDRTKHILNESKPVLIITQSGNESDTAFGNMPALSYEKLFSLAEPLEASKLREDEILTSSLGDPIEMVLYTSGSTGLSKGVRVKKSSILNRLQWQWYEVPYLPQEKTFVFKTALTFVDSVSEIWGPILCPTDLSDGPRTLLIVPKEITTNPQRLLTLLNKYKIGRLVLVPSLLKAILLYTGLSKENADLLNNLKIWICSGEPLAPSLALQFFRSFRTGSHVLYNFYGSTEMMGDVTYHAMKSPNDLTVDNKVPIGVPLDNTAIYLLNNQLQPVPMGEVGELFAAGLNIAAGYVNGRDPNHFIPNPHAVGPDFRFLYRTGDYAKLVKGTLLFEGRTDSQVKVRGHRVDLSEVEAALIKCPEVQKGIVLCHNPGEPDQQIVAFVKPEDGVEVAPYDIEQKMTSGVPKYAIPQVIIVKELPYLVNGKVDRQTLLRQYRNMKSQNGCGGTGIDLKGLNKEELTAGECLFRTISEVLGSSARGPITKDANFYSLGGNSLNSVLTISLLIEQGYAISVTDFISAQTLGDVLNRMCVTGVANHTSKSHWDKFNLEILDDRHKEDAFRIIGDSFCERADVERITACPGVREEFIVLLKSVWPYIVKHGSSIAVLDAKTKEVVGVCLLMNADDEPTEVNLNGQLRYTMEFLDYIEMPIRENVLPKGKLLHSFMLGTSQDKTSQENIEITEYMEEKVLELAKEQGYIGIFTTNSSPLTQQLAEVMNYQKLKIYQINEYVAPDGTRPFKRAPDDQLAIVSWRKT
uniref:Mycosubtilin synthase subunit C n=1 Tax=Lygus hesperus TaxID=30085 RepID=A0A146KNY6_LYGHE